MTPRHSLKIPLLKSLQASTRLGSSLCPHTENPTPALTTATSHSFFFFFNELCRYDNELVKTHGYRYVCLYLFYFKSLDSFSPFFIILSIASY